MNDLVEKLRKYFNQNTDEQIRKDWEKSKEFDEIKPTVEDFIDIQLKNKNKEFRCDECNCILDKKEYKKGICEDCLCPE